ncbi:MAG: hypothetical protein GY787_13725 [Alteromonadales bacterium]|nr:hypothetical protein [Alteromonadales bacterium]
MAKHKSPGQKRKGIVRIISLLLFLGATYIASTFINSLNTDELKWVDEHKEAVGNIKLLNQYEEEYRTLKGRTRYRDIYEMSYSFTVAAEEYENTTTISKTTYSSSQVGENVTIWYASNNPYTNDTKNNVESAVSDNDAAGNIFAAIPYTGPAGLFIYWLLNLIFVRESKKALPEGFYTETSWLDIDDNYIVAIDNSDLVFFDIEAKQASDVQEAYQNNAPLEELIAISKSSKFKRIPFTEITEIESDHNSDVFTITHGEDSHSVEFLNQTVKAHALEAVKKQIPASLEYTKKERTRLQAAVPSFIFLAVLALIAVVADIFILNVVIGFIGIIWVLPKIFSRLIDPTITEKWCGIQTPPLQTNEQS